MKVCWSSNINGSIKELNDVDDTLPTIVENGDTSSTKSWKQRHFSNKSWKQLHFSNKSWTTLFSEMLETVWQGFVCNSILHDHHWRPLPQKLSGKVYWIALPWLMLTCWPVVGGRCHACRRCCWTCWTSMAYDAKNEQRKAEAVAHHEIDIIIDRWHKLSYVLFFIMIIRWNSYYELRKIIENTIKHW